MDVICQDCRDEKCNREDSGDNRHDLISASFLSTGENIHFRSTHNGSRCAFGFSGLKKNNDDHDEG